MPAPSRRSQVWVTGRVPRCSQDAPASIALMHGQNGGSRRSVSQSFAGARSYMLSDIESGWELDSGSEEETESDNDDDYLEIRGEGETETDHEDDNLVNTMTKQLCCKRTKYLSRRKKQCLKLIGTLLAVCGLVVAFGFGVLCCVGACGGEEEAEFASAWEERSGAQGRNDVNGAPAREERPQVGGAVEQKGCCAVREALLWGAGGAAACGGLALVFSDDLFKAGGRGAPGPEAEGEGDHGSHASASSGSGDGEADSPHGGDGDDEGPTGDEGAAYPATTGTQEAVHASTGAEEAEGAPTGTQEAVQSSTGAEEAEDAPTGTQEAVHASTGAEEAKDAPTGTQEAVQSLTGAEEAEGAPTGTQEAVHASTGAHEAEEAEDARAGTQETVHAPTGSQEAVDSVEGVPDDLSAADGAAVDASTGGLQGSGGGQEPTVDVDSGEQTEAEDFVDARQESSDDSSYESCDEGSSGDDDSKYGDCQSAAEDFDGVGLAGEDFDGRQGSSGDDSALLLSAGSWQPSTAAAGLGLGLIPDGY